MLTRTSLLFLVSAGSVVAAQGPFTTSLVFDPSSATLVLTTVTVTVTRTSLSPPTTILNPISTTTTTLVVSSSPPGTTTTTIHSVPNPSSSRRQSSIVPTTPLPSTSLVPPPTFPDSGSLARNPGALAGLIVGLCVIVAGLLVFAWFTLKRHRLRDLENQASDPPSNGGMRRSVSVVDVPPGSRIIDDDPDLEVQSSVGHDMRSSSLGHGALVSSHFVAVGPEDSPEQRVDSEIGYLATYPTAASSNGHSSHGHGTMNTRNSSLTQVTRNPSPTVSRQNPNRTRFSISPDRGPIPSAWHSEAPTRRGSIDDVSTALYNPHRVNSEPVAFNDTSLMSVYRRQSSEVPRPDLFSRPGPSIMIHTATPNPPSSLLRPSSATQIPTLETLQRSQPSTVYLGLPLVNEPHSSPATSNVSFHSGRFGLLGTPPNHPTESLSSLRDDFDYSRPLGVGVVSALRDSTSMAEADSESEVLPNQGSTHRRSTSG